MAGEWQNYPLGTLTDWSSGGTPSKNNPAYWGGAIPWISASSMKSGRLYESDRTITDAGLKNGSRIAPPGAVLLLVRGSELHKRIPIGIALRPVAFNQDVKALLPRAGIESSFLYYWLTGNASMLLQKVEHTGIGAGKLDTKVMQALPVYLPPIPEQRAIAHILGTLDDKIELNRRMNETLEALARALFKSWFVDFDPVRANAEGRDPGLPKPLANLFPNSFKDSELGGIPKGWAVAQIGELAKVVGGSTPSTKEASFWSDGRHYWATPKDLSILATPVLLETERKITDAGLAQIGSGLLPPGTVLLSSRAPIGYLAVSEVPVAINQGFIAMLPAKGVPNLFLLYWAGWAHEEIVSRSNGSTFLEISKANFRPIPVVTPPAGVFDAFGKLVGPLYAQIVSDERESRALAALRDALLPKLMTGEIRVPISKKPTGRMS